MRKINRHLTIATAFVALTACSGSDAEPPPLDTEAPTTTVETAATSAPGTTTTSAPGTTTTTAPTTTATTEPSATILVTTTNEAPDTTSIAPPATDPKTDAELIADIEADLNEGEAAFLRGAADPGAPASIDLARQYNVGTSLEFILNFYARLAATQVRYRAGDLESFIEVLSLEPTSATSANVRICRVDASVEYVLEEEGREEVITDDRIIRYVSDNEVVLDGGVWKLGDGSPVSEAEGTTTCAGA